jgi:hypothetical protein
MVEVAHLVEKRRLQPGEREVEAGHARHGESVGLRVASVCQAVEGGAARVAEAEQSRALVESLTRRVVEGRADRSVARVILDVEKDRMAAAGEQAEEGRFDRVGLEVERGDVAVEVVDRDERQVARPGDCLRR